MQLMRTDGPVVVALDGTPHSARTLEWGVAEAVRRQAPVLLVRVVDDTWQISAWSGYPAAGCTDLDIQVEQYLTEQAKVVEEHHTGVRVDTRTMHGQVVPCLGELSAYAQLVVVGAHLRTGRTRTGTTGVHVAAHALCPVAVVRSETQHLSTTGAPVVVGVDGSPASLAAARLAAREARMSERTLKVVHARPTIADPLGRGSFAPLTAGDENDPVHKAARAVTSTLRAENEGLEVDLALVDDDPADALVRMTAGAALLVVGSRGLGSFRGMLLGSVSSAVVREATVPVIVVHDER
jgi:nucleotide-binding universal stress UspA family protein